MNTATSSAAAGAAAPTGPAGASATGQEPTKQAVGQAAGQPSTPALPEWSELRKSIPAELANEKVWDSFKDTGAFLKSFVDTHKYNVGAVRMPTKDSKPEDKTRFRAKVEEADAAALFLPSKEEGQEAWDKFLTKLGRPATADGYKFSLPALPEGLDYDQNLLGAFSKAAHAAGLAPGQAQAILNAYGEVAKSTFTSLNRQTQTTYKQLEEEYGPGYKMELAYAQAAIKQVFGDTVMKRLASNPMGNDPDFIRGMIRVGKLLSEDSIVDVREIKESAQGFQNEIDRTLADKKHPYFNPRHPEHKKAVERMNHLYAMIAPGKVGTE